MPTGTRPDPPTRSLRVAFELSYPPAFASNVMWFFLTGSGTITLDDLTSLVEQISSAYAGAFVEPMSTNLVHNATVGTFWGSGGDVLATSVAGFGAGTGEGTALPANVAVGISWRVAAHYRGGHPRTYLCGITQDMTDTVTTIAPATAFAIRDAANVFHTAVEDITGISGVTTVEHGTMSFVNDGAWRTPPLFRRIQLAAVDARLDTQRRRLGRDVAA